MVKGKLIENIQYYKLRSKQLIIGLVPTIILMTLCLIILSGIIQVTKMTIVLVIVAAFILTLIAIILVLRIKKQMNQFTNQKIELDANEIRLISKNGKLNETINLIQLDKILVKEESNIPQQTTMTEIGDEITEKYNMRYVEIIQNDSQRRFDFELDSNYMLNQLNMTIENWKQNKVNVEFT